MSQAFAWTLPPIVEATWDTESTRTDARSHTAHHGLIAPTSVSSPPTRRMEWKIAIFTRGSRGKELSTETFRRRRHEGYAFALGAEGGFAERSRDNPKDDIRITQSLRGVDGHIKELVLRTTDGRLRTRTRREVQRRSPHTVDGSGVPAMSQAGHFGCRL